VDAVTEERQVAKKSDRLVGPPPEKAGVYLSRGSVPPRGAVVGQRQRRMEACISRNYR
jgi:hypothetical protein